MITLSCGIKISALRHLVLSQSTRVTDGKTDRQNYDSQDRPRICSRGKNGGLDQYGAEPFEQQRFGTAGVEEVNHIFGNISVVSKNSPQKLRY